LERVAAAVRGFDALSSVAILASIGLPATTGNARRIARSMRSLGYIPIKSRRLPPGGWSDTLCRGWARPVRQPTSKQRDKVTSLHPKTNRTDEREDYHVQS
jgi:hypothetical protein